MFNFFLAGFASMLRNISWTFYVSHVDDIKEKQAPYFFLYVGGKIFIFITILCQCLWML